MGMGSSSHGEQVSGGATRYQGQTGLSQGSSGKDQQGSRDVPEARDTLWEQRVWPIPTVRMASHSKRGLLYSIPIVHGLLSEVWKTPDYCFS